MTPIDRRTFLSSSAGAVAGLALSRSAFAAGQDKIRVGLVGCGGRGTGAAGDCLTSSEGVELVAMGDLFPERLAGSRERITARLTEAGKPEAVQVPDDRMFSGWDAYRSVLASDIDLVIFATPPHFRPGHLEAAIAAGKHVFMEKPVAVDAPGVRRVLAAGRSAQEQGLGIVSGTQRRHQDSYLQTMDRVRDGAVGEIVGGQVWWNQGGLWMHPRQEGWTDMEWQLRNWLYFTWASGDHIVEQHIHNLDVMCWALGGPPVRATALGGRQSRTDPAYGNVFDHFAVQYEFADGVLIESQCRQIDNCANRVGERFVGTRGTLDPNGRIQGENAWAFEGDQPNPYVQEHAHLIASIRAGRPLNEAEQVAHSTLVAILGRTAAYTGKSITFEQMLASELDLTPPAYEFGELPVGPVAIPGETPFV